MPPPLNCGVKQTSVVVPPAKAEWLAVGRLNVSGQGYCTATLIAPDMVMTAGHCVVDRRTGRPVEPGRVHFLAGFRAGTYAAHGIGRAVAIVPGFDRAAADVARDLALVRLVAPMAPRVQPIPVLDVEIKLDDPRARLKPGQPVRVELAVADSTVARPGAAR